MMDGQISLPTLSNAGTGKTGEEDPGQSSLRRAMRRVGSLLPLPKTNGTAGTLEELLAHDDGGGMTGTDDPREMMLNVLNLQEMRVEDVSVPRADIVSVEVSASLDETLEKFRTSSHSRLPVYRETLDDPVGVVHLKDIALSYGFGARANDFSLANHLRSVLVVPPSMKLQDLLQRMQATRRHMALVIDEYGGVDGLATIEDVIEQIVGQIEDEHDPNARAMWTRSTDGSYLAHARADIDEFQVEVGQQLLPSDWEEEVDTLGGLVFVLCGRVPERGEVISHPDGHEFEILDADPRRIKRIRVRLSTSEKGENTTTDGGSA